MFTQLTYKFSVNFFSLAFLYLNQQKRKIIYFYSIIMEIREKKTFQIIEIFVLIWGRLKEFYGDDMTREGIFPIVKILMTINTIYLLKIKSNSSFYHMQKSLYGTTCGGIFHNTSFFLTHTYTHSTSYEENFRKSYFFFQSLFFTFSWFQCFWRFTANSR